jgi:hypothetical protein
VSPANRTGQIYRANLAAAKAKAQANDSTAYDRGREAGLSLGYDAGYRAGADAGIMAGWDDAVEFVVNAGLVTQQQVDAAVDEHNARLATNADDQAPED